MMPLVNTVTVDMELPNSNLKNEDDLTQPYLKDTFDYNGTSTIDKGRSRQIET